MKVIMSIERRSIMNEDLSSYSNDTITIESETNQVKKFIFKDILIYFFALICIINTTITYILYTKYNSLKSETEDVFNQSKNVQREFSEFQSKVKDLESKITVNSVANEININSIAGLQMAQELKFYGVTDNLIVEKAGFSFNGDATIDIYTQPAYTKYYRGQGKFDVNDRELKSELLNIVDKVKAVYDMHRKPTMSEFEKIKLYLTIKNYEIGTYENGQILLKGE
jgi:cell division protein FtsL